MGSSGWTTRARVVAAVGAGALVGTVVAVLVRRAALRVVGEDAPGAQAPEDLRAVVDLPAA